jgi:hypothetical protein
LNNEGINKILIDFGTDLKEDLQKSLIKKGREKAAKYGSVPNDNTNLGDSIRPEIIETESGLIFNLNIADYYKWVDGGRKPGGVSRAGRASIKQWIRQKGINPSEIIQKISGSKTAVPFAKAQEQLSFLIARKIKREGYKANRFFSSVLEDGRLKDLEEDLKKETGKQIRIILNGGNDLQ